MSAPKPGDRVAVLHDCKSDFAADGIVRHETPVLVTSVLRNKAGRTRVKGVRCDNSLIEWWVGDDAEWRCPDCPWVHAAHPDYGWQKHDDRAVEVHQTKLCPQRTRDGGTTDG